MKQDRISGIAIIVGFALWAIIVGAQMCRKT